MADRTYYETAEELYELFIKHPVMSKMLDEFEIDVDYDPSDTESPLRLRDVCEYLVANKNIIIDSDISPLYNDSQIIQEMAALYGFDELEYPLPYDQYKSSSHTTLEEFLNYNLYCYKFLTIDNFYEKHFMDFIPEFDREQIEENPKLKLAVESIGRKLDDIEDRVTRLKTIYDPVTTPEQVLDYLGQNLGYEREDFTLSGFSFRELLRNIIEIYKVKGTNHSFSFFFKFLGFEINLKEFYFNRDSDNPEGFPGMDESKVENFLTVKNPIKDTAYNSPASNLENIRNLEDWETEYNLLVNKGCINPSEYIRGIETYNRDQVTWHSNPWKYFKTNLIEYELNPFFDKLNLTSSDNETIRKYVKFLSPTYLFTWININLRPWIEDANIIQDTDTDWRINIVKSLGDPHPTPMNWPAHPQGQMGVPENPLDIYNKKTATDPGFNGLDDDGEYLDYEKVGNWIALFDPDTDSLRFNLTNNMNLGGDDQVGSSLRHDGVHNRQQGHPRHIADAKHDGNKRVAYENLANSLKLNTDPDQPEYWIDYSESSYPAIPVIHFPKDGRSVSDTKTPLLSWEQTEGSIGYWIQFSDSKYFNIEDIIYKDNTLIITDFLIPDELTNNYYYWRIKSKNASDYVETNPEKWTAWSSIFNFNLKVLPFPSNNEVINKDTIYVSSTYILESGDNVFSGAQLTIEWEDISEALIYNIQLSTDEVFNGIVFDEETSNPEFEYSEFINARYYWRYRYKIRGQVETYSDWSITNTFDINFPVII